MYPHIFQPLQFRTFSVKNRIFRSNISGRFDNYDGSGNQARINWELKFARGGVGAIISSFVPVHMRGRIMPNYATIDSDDAHPVLARARRREVHEHDCRFILQLSHGGRQRDIPGIEYATGLSSTGEPEPLHGFECERMTIAQIQRDRAGVRRGRAARARGRPRRRGTARRQRLPDHPVPQLGDQRPRGRVRRRAGEPRALRAGDRAGDPRARRPRLPPADEDQRHRVQQRAAAEARSRATRSRTRCRCASGCEEAGVDAIHVSSGSCFPHPKNPAGDLPIDELPQDLRQPDLERQPRAPQLPLLPCGRDRGHLPERWEDARGPREEIEGLNLPDAVPSSRRSARFR